MFVFYFSMTAYSASQEREMKKLTLRKRRLKLEKMFTDEQNQYEVSNLPCQAPTPEGLSQYLEKQCLDCLE